MDGRILLLDAINQTLAASFNLSLPGEYPLTVWLQSPAGSAAAELLLNTTLHVAAGRPLLSNTAVSSCVSCRSVCAVMSGKAHVSACSLVLKHA